MGEVENRLRQVLILEEQDSPDWDDVRGKCDEIIRLINENQLREYKGTIGYRFAEDYDVRQKSNEYAIMQRQKLHQWLEEH